ncbi:hypothetical protein ACT7CX_29320 [Bacillus cereus]
MARFIDTYKFHFGLGMQKVIERMTPEDKFFLPMSFNYPTCLHRIRPYQITKSRWLLVWVTPWKVLMPY